MKASILIYAAAITTLAACGHKDDAPAATTAAVTTPAAPNDFQGGVACGDRVVHAFLRLDRLCGGSFDQLNVRDPMDRSERGPDNRGEQHSCIERGNEFLAAFPQMDCVVSSTDRFGRASSVEIFERNVKQLMFQQHRR